MLGQKICKIVLVLQTGDAEFVTNIQQRILFSLNPQIDLLIPFSDKTGKI